MDNEHITKLIKFERDKIKSLRKRRKVSSRNYIKMIDNEIKTIRVKIIDYQMMVLRNKKSELLK